MLEEAVGVVGVDAQAVDEVGAQLSGLHRLWSEFGHGGDKTDFSSVATARIGQNLSLHAVVDVAQVGLVDKGAYPNGGDDGEGVDRVGGVDDGAWLADTGQDDAVGGGKGFGVGEVVLETLIADAACASEALS